MDTTGALFRMNICSGTLLAYDTVSPYLLGTHVQNISVDEAHTEVCLIKRTVISPAHPTKGSSHGFSNTSFAYCLCSQKPVLHTAFR